MRSHVLCVTPFYPKTLNKHRNNDTTAENSNTKYKRHKKTQTLLAAQIVKNPLAMQETWVQSLSQEEGKATHSSIPAWIIPWTEEPGRFIVHGCQEPALESPPMTRSCRRALMGKVSQNSRGSPLGPA